MRIREYTPADLETIEKLHNGGFELPDFSHPLVIARKVLVDDDERVRMAAFGRLHVNAMLFVDKTYKSPAERLEAVNELQKELLARGRALGLDITTTQAEGRFAERLEDMGWVKGFGQMFYRSME